MKNRRTNWENYVDFILMPPIIFLSAYVPHFGSGLILSLDEGQHLASVDALARGLIPFREIYFMHGPLLEYTLYWTMKLCGFQLSVARGFFMFGNILVLLLFFILIRSLISNWVLKYGTLLFVLRYPIFFVWMTRYGGIRWLPGIGVLLFMYHWLCGYRRSFLFFAGLTCGLGLLISQEIGLSAGFAAGTVIFLDSLNHRAARRFKRILIENGLLFFVGFLAPVLPFYIYFMFHHAFIEYLRIEFIDTLFLLPARIPYSPPLLGITNIFRSGIKGNPVASRSLALYVVAVVYVIMGLWVLFNYRKRHHKRIILLIMVMCYSAVLLKGVTRCLTGPQFNVALPFLFVAVALFLDIALDSKLLMGEAERVPHDEENPVGLSRWKNVFLLVGIAATVVISGNPVGAFRTHLGNLWMVPGGHVTMNPDIVPRAQGSRIPSQQAADIEGVVKFLRENTDENEQIFTFPSEGHINFLADRQSASRFVIAIYSKVREEYMEEITTELDTKQVRYIIYAPGDYQLLEVPNEKRLAPIWQYIQSNYKTLQSFENMQILQRMHQP
jgi:hypothetical protein